MQYVLTVLIQVIVLVFVASAINDFVYGLLNPVQQIQSIHSTHSAKIVTLDWVQPVDEVECEVECEVVDIIKLAIPRMKATDLKQLASSRKVKGYSRMRKEELILALQR